MKSLMAGYVYEIAFKTQEPKVQILCGLNI